ncbi:hypothetical protein BUALT_Bualt06G0136400 [Buddleja alternifolia]|uniref:Uncharacterized protein n=1 Tax=Buddleja alternifolia TaxID=168488 RepID=A0AAV6XEM7_9LAMI|nr:hypothetical protein BUALT_Bualt06G0136400 [Buddleja alternifolia]
MDGKIIEFTSPILVKELLINFEGFGVKSSKRASNSDLPPNFELKLGNIYYLLPSKAPLDRAEKRAGSVSVEVEAEPNSGVKRIKVVITKKQLQELLSKKTSTERIIFGIDQARPVVDPQINWKPSLVSIPEDDD